MDEQISLNLNANSLNSSTGYESDNLEHNLNFISCIQSRITTSTPAPQNKHIGKRLSIKDDRVVDVTEPIQKIKSMDDTRQALLDGIQSDIKFRHLYSSMDQTEDEWKASHRFISRHPYLFESKIFSSLFLDVKPIASGHLSTVYLAKHRLSGEKYVIKEGKQSIEGTLNLSKSSKECWNENHVLSVTGNHPNIVKLFNSWIENEMFYLQIEYVSGGSLYDYLVFKTMNDSICSTVSNMAPNDALGHQQTRSISILAAWMLLAQIGSALNYVNNHCNIVHGDVKPSNILLSMIDKSSPDDMKLHCHQQLASNDVSPSLRFKLADFGRSSFIIQEKLRDGDGRYLAPFFDEIPTDERPIAKIQRDTYALGVTVYQSMGLNFNTDVSQDIRDNVWKSWPTSMTDEMRQLVMSMCCPDFRQRIRITDLLNHDSVKAFITSEVEVFNFIAKQRDKSQKRNESMEF